MSANSSFKFLLSLGAIAVFSLSLTSEANAQRGFRIGNIMQAGGGQGFRLGGPRAGMHFGGGQGATIGTQNFGMRFGNGQGARFGGQQYGMQFGGRQGTQIGQFSTRPTVSPGTYYYGDMQRRGFVQPNIQQAPAMAQQQGVYSQPSVVGAPAMIPTTAQPNSSVVQTQANLALNSPASNLDAGNGTQVDIASAEFNKPAIETAPEPVAGLRSKESATVLNETSKKVAPGIIRLRHATDAQETMTYDVNGTEFKLAPGESALMQTGTQWTINFSAGESLGAREAILTEAGTYAFDKSQKDGWAIVDDQPVAAAEYETSEDPGATANEFLKSEGIQLDAPATHADGASVLKTEVKTEPVISPESVAPPKSTEDNDN